MTSHTTKPDSSQPAAEMAVDLFDNWFDPIETAVRARARDFIEELIRGELDAVLVRPRYGRSQMAGDEASAGVTSDAAPLRADRSGILASSLSWLRSIVSSVISGATPCGSLALCR